MVGVEECESKYDTSMKEGDGDSFGGGRGGGVSGPALLLPDVEIVSGSAPLLPDNERESNSFLPEAPSVKDDLRAFPGVDLVRPVTRVEDDAKASVDLVGELLRAAVGEDLLEFGADLARAFSFFFAIFAFAMERCSCDTGVRRISRGSRGISTGPMGVVALTLTRKSNLISAKSVFNDSPIGH